MGLRIFRNISCPRVKGSFKYGLDDYGCTLKVECLPEFVCLWMV